MGGQYFHFGIKVLSMELLMAENDPTSNRIVLNLWRGPRLTSEENTPKSYFYEIATHLTHIFLYFAHLDSF